jgi:sugar phosphate permease
MRINWQPPQVFYGWWIVAACFLIALYTAGVIFYGFTAIFEPVAAEFGWSYAQISFAASIRGVEAGLLAPFVGILVDRWGPRRLMFSGVLFNGLGLLLLSQTTSLGMFYTASIIMAIGLSCCGISVTVTAVANWFRRKVGIASGVMIAGYGSSGLLVPVMVRLIDTYEWRTALVILALGMFTVGLPMSLLVRHKPEQYGYLPDGEANDKEIPEQGEVTPQNFQVDFTARQALKRRTFWHIILALMPQFVVVTAVITHLMPYLSSIGIARSMSGLVATAIPLLSIGGRLGFGWLGDRFSRKYLTAGALTIMALGLLCFEYISTGSMWLIIPFLIFFSIGFGGNVTMLGVLLRHYFGRGKFGTIIGITWGILMWGNLAGPPIAGWVFDNWGSYQGIWVAFTGLVAIGVIIMATAPSVQTKSREIDSTS